MGRGGVCHPKEAVVGGGGGGERGERAHDGGIEVVSQVRRDAGGGL